jgi:colicin import membrane protein
MRGSGSRPRSTPTKQAEKIVKAKLSAWTLEQQRIADEARRKAADEARRAREEAERKAAAERARAQAAADEARRKAEEAAKKEGRRQSRRQRPRCAAAAAERARREEEERQKLAAGERKAQELELNAASAAASVPAVVETKAPAGFSMRKNWIAELADDTTKTTRSSPSCAPSPAGARSCSQLLALDWKSAEQARQGARSEIQRAGSEGSQ